MINRVECVAENLALVPELRLRRGFDFESPIR